MAIVPRRCAALLAAVVTVAGLLSAPASAASAATTKAAVNVTAAARTSAVAARDVKPPRAVSDGICLTNQNSYCLGISDADAVVISTAIHEIVRIILVYIGKDSEGDNEDEEEDSSNGLCLTDTGLRPGVGASWGPCGANGTVWILVPHTDGAYMYSRYSVDNHDSMVLTADPLTSGARMYVDIAANPGSPYWQTFTYYN